MRARRGSSAPPPWARAGSYIGRRGLSWVSLGRNPNQVTGIDRRSTPGRKGAGRNSSAFLSHRLMGVIVVIVIMAVMVMIMVVMVMIVIMVVVVVMPGVVMLGVVMRMGRAVIVLMRIRIVLDRLGKLFARHFLF